jgi:hypothetical protein
MARVGKQSRANFSTGDIKRIRAELAKKFGSGPRAESSIVAELRALNLDKLSPIERARVRARFNFPVA